MLFVRTKIQFFESKSQPNGGKMSEVTLFVRTKIQFFESKSQHQATAPPIAPCCSSEQRYNFLKANHNTVGDELIAINVVRQNKDTIFWKQITTQIFFKLSYCKLFVRTKIQFFESKSQHTKSCACTNVCCSSEQRYNFLKANHNHSRHITSRIWLFVRTKIQFFESKSQLYVHYFYLRYRCSSEQRYNFLKANHNRCCLVCRCILVVRQNKDTIFWKQITTPLRCTNFQ